MRINGSTNKFFKVCFLVLTAGLTLSLAACGDSGGGGGGGGLTYSGNTSPAAITETSAEDIALAAYGAGSAGGNLADAAGMVASGEDVEAVTNPRTLLLARTIAENLKRKNQSKDSETLAVGVTESGTYDGSCGGTASWSSTYSYTETAINSTDTITFSSYCHEGDPYENFDTGGATYTSGSMSISSSFTEVSMDATININNLSVTDSSDSYTMDGNMSMVIVMDMVSWDTTMTINMVMHDNNTDHQAKLENYVMTVDDGGSATISGKVYDSTYGYVLIDTIAALTFGATEHPDSGELEFTGAEGVKIRLTFIDSNSYQVTADLNTDGDNAVYTIDYDFGCLPWNVALPSCSGGIVGGTTYWIETFPNGSAPTVDTKIALYHSSDLGSYVDYDDDSGTSLYSALFYDLVPGETYYIKVYGYASYEEGGYSIRVSDTGFGGASTATPGDPDAFEPGDDTSSGATVLTLNTVSDHTITYDGDVDWFEFTVPAAP